MREGRGVLRSNSWLARKIHSGESLQRCGASEVKVETFKSVARSGSVAMKRLWVGSITTFKGSWGCPSFVLLSVLHFGKAREIEEFSEVVIF